MKKYGLMVLFVCGIINSKSEPEIVGGRMKSKSSNDCKSVVSAAMESIQQYNSFAIKDNKKSFISEILSSNELKQCVTDHPKEGYKLLDGLIKRDFPSDNSAFEELLVTTDIRKVESNPNFNGDESLLLSALYTGVYSERLLRAGANPCIIREERLALEKRKLEDFEVQDSLDNYRKNCGEHNLRHIYQSRNK